MNQRQPSIISAILLIAVLFIFNGCRKDRDKDLDETLGYDTGIFESVSNDVDNMLGQVVQDGTVNQRLPSGANQFNLNGCAIVSHDTLNDIITIDFGNGCTGSDGRTRSGSISINYSGSYFVAGSSHTVSFTNYFVDTRRIEGARTVTNNGLNVSGNTNWTVVAANMKMTRSDGFWRTWNSTRNREMTQGFGDQVWSNDVYRINGSATGTNSDGNSFSMSITNLLRDNSCYWIRSGAVAITSANGQTRTVDFGNGACDDQATVTVGGQTRSITLR
jgi:hypothetical protein